MSEVPLYFIKHRSPPRPPPECDRPASGWIGPPRDGYERARSTLTSGLQLKGSSPHKFSTKNNVTSKMCTGIHVLYLKSAFDEQTRQIRSLQHIHRYSYVWSCHFERDLVCKDFVNLGHMSGQRNFGATQIAKKSIIFTFENDVLLIVSSS